MSVDPETTGNTANTLGTLEQCVRVDVDSERWADGVADVTIDVIVQGDTLAPVGYDAWVIYDVGSVNDGCPADGPAESADECLNVGDDDSDGKPNDGCWPARGTPESGIQCENSLEDDSDGLVDPVGWDDLSKLAAGAASLTTKMPPQLNAGALHLGGVPGTPGDGTLVRIDLDVISQGVVTFGFAKGAYKSAPDVAHPVTTGTALLAINQDCPLIPPPSATSTSIPSSTPTATPSDGTGSQDLVSGWNNVCYMGPPQPIGDALRDIGDEIQAVYRLGSGQAIDRWFPGKPELSTITTVDAYEPLFILSRQSIVWTQQPFGVPPASAQLAWGWNNVCYAGQTEDGGTATQSIGGKFAVIYWLGLDQSWKRFVPERPEISDLVQMQRLSSVLILVTAEDGAQWVFEP